MRVRLDSTKVPFSLDHTLECGQLFRWQKLGDWWYGVVEDMVVKIKQTADGLTFQTFPERTKEDFIENYFRLDDDLPSILDQISKDELIRSAIERFHGLRISRQEPWECLISYICATYKSIPAIKNMILNLSRRFGEKITVNERDFYMFPKPSDLARASLRELRGCKLGFRAERILETSKILDRGELNLEDLKKTGYEKAKQKLLSLQGVGQKVADCVLLFSLDKLEAFPVDVWIRRAVLEFYPRYFEYSFFERVSSKSTITPHEYETISSFGREYFGKYAGYAQEYLFHSLRAREIRL
ncbi:MAG: DNA-3-methyladenine glycosylase 2 family protein [Candidatus Bathyarchaeota archaeon]|nr:MAG: DNA-3-methyladenine glycosylase 2 family protein [Candidatus Bathyarchaeota archaeon]